MASLFWLLLDCWNTREAWGVLETGRPNRNIRNNLFPTGARDFFHLETKKGLQEPGLGPYLLGCANGRALFIAPLTEAHNIGAVQ